MTAWPPRPRTHSTQRTWTLTRECAVLLFVSQVLVVMIHTKYRMAQGYCACHNIHVWSVRLSDDFESSIPFYFLIFPSSLTSCTSSCTSSTVLRAVATLCTSRERRSTLLTTLNSSQFKSFYTIQRFGHNWCWANEIRVEYFHKIHNIAALQQRPRAPVKNERKARRFYRTNHLHVDV